MVVEVASKEELQIMSSKLKNASEQLTSEASVIIGNLSEIEDYDGINISSAAQAIENNLRSISSGIETLSSKLTNYVADIKEFDTYDLKSDDEEENNYNLNNSNQNIYSDNKKEIKDCGAIGSQKITNDVSNGSFNNNKKDNNFKSIENVENNSSNSNYNLNGSYYEQFSSMFEVTTGNLEYELNNNDFDLLCAIVSAEGDKSYDGSLTVISTILNRCEHPAYVASYGQNPVAQATANNQFFGYLNNNYKQYLGGKCPETVVLAVKDALSGIRNHKICYFDKNNMISL